MNTRLALAAAVLAVFAAAVAACSATPGGTTQGITPASDGGTIGADAAPIVVAQPGQLALSVQKARRGGSGGKKRAWSSSPSR